MILVLSLISICIIIYTFIEAKKSWQDGNKLEGFAAFALIPFFPILMLIIYFKR